MRLVLLGGFLGAGKTTTMLAAAKVLGAAGRSVAVITNDQGDELVDTATASEAVPAAQVDEVTGGCFCCRFDELDDVLQRVGDAGTEVVFAEAVGSCTDLAATVIAPLRELRPELVDLAPLTVLVDARRLVEIRSAPDHLDYLFGRQLAEADLVVLNKIDRLTPGELATARRSITASAPEATVLNASARTGEGLPALLDAWQLGSPRIRPVAVDYDRYAAAEAALGWLNQRWQLTATRPFSPADWCRDLLTRLSAELGPGVLLGHAKVAVRSPAGFARGALVSTAEEPWVTDSPTPASPTPASPTAASSTTASSATASLPATSLPVTSLPAASRTTTAVATINVRAACPPTVVERAVATAAMGALDGAVVAIAQPARAFAPQYPRPVHRMESR